MTDSTIPLEQHLNEISKWEKNIANLSNEIVYLKEQIEWFKRQIFGQKTEKFVEPNQNAHQLLFEGLINWFLLRMKKSTHSGSRTDKTQTEWQRYHYSS